jgi:hypothetical protein
MEGGLMSAQIGGRVLSRAYCLWLMIGLLALPVQARYGDGRVDLRDFALVARRWRQADTGSWSGNRYAAPDGIVDFDDLSHWADLWLAHLW